MKFFRKFIGMIPWWAWTVMVFLITLRFTPGVAYSLWGIASCILAFYMMFRIAFSKKKERKK